MNADEQALARMDDDGYGCIIPTREERDEARARKLGSVPPTDQFVSMAELHALWADLTACGILFNGMTHHYLAERYGTRLYHVMGGGWFVRPEEGGPS